MANEKLRLYISQVTAQVDWTTTLKPDYKRLRAVSSSFCATMTGTEGQGERALTAVKDTLDDIKSRPHRQQVIIGVGSGL